MKGFGWVLLWVAGLGGVAQGQTEAAKAPATVFFSIDRPGLQVPRWAMTVREDGQASYHAEPIATTPGADAPPAIDRPLVVTAATDGENL